MLETQCDVFDLGLQQERTTLAWNRTGLSMIVCGSLLVRDHGDTAPIVFLMIGGATSILGTWMLVAAGLRYRQMDKALRASQNVTSYRWIRAIATCTLLFAVAVVVRAWFP